MRKEGQGVRESRFLIQRSARRETAAGQARISG